VFCFGSALLNRDSERDRYRGSRLKGLETVSRWLGVSNQGSMTQLQQSLTRS
jgi:hypothetical protein